MVKTNQEQIDLWKGKEGLSVDFIFLFFGIMCFIVELWNYPRITDEA